MGKIILNSEWSKKSFLTQYAANYTKDFQGLLTVLSALFSGNGSLFLLLLECTFSEEASPQWWNLHGSAGNKPGGGGPLYESDGDARRLA